MRKESRPMKILFVSSECAPFSKSGGLADVAFSLPPALQKTGDDMAIVIPMYRVTQENCGDQFELVKTCSVTLGQRSLACSLYRGALNGVPVYAIGNPLGELTFSMSQGIVSCCDRAINVDGTPFNMIQVDCSINPGNSGGPLMNLYGEVVGIVSAKYSTYSSTTVEGLGFAIPIDDVKSIITDIMENGAVTGKAYMAVTVGTMNSQMAAQYSIDIDQGVFVYSVVKGGAGDKAGLRLGDVITKMGDTTLTSRQDLSAALKSYRAGDTATLTVFRDGSYITTDITFDQQPQITGTDTEEDTSSQGGNNGGYSGQMPENWQEFYNYFFGNRG